MRILFASAVVGLFAIAAIRIASANDQVPLQYFFPNNQGYLSFSGNTFRFQCFTSGTQAWDYQEWNYSQWVYYPSQGATGSSPINGTKLTFVVTTSGEYSPVCSPENPSPGAHPTSFAWKPNNCDGCTITMYPEANFTIYATIAP